ncbi:L-rhamnose mutarotase [Propionispira raffinosivorans]|uniref:L-rhamnose mutarotase n=1 Tax=Propionispira raffinosivorans TaxID=86959 RepID=UPI00036FFB7D|nr:L-rhamnose mutarotase [Propionispira raffinosivorans]
MLEVVDSHFHIWDLNVLHLPWLDLCAGIKKSFSVDDLCKVYAKHEVDFKGGVFVEVDCDLAIQEDEYIFNLKSSKILARIMRAPHLCAHMRLPMGIVGVREPLHIDTSPRGRCLEQSFLEGLEVLVDRNMIFESCNRVEELEDLYQAAAQIPKAKIVINHCGNVKQLTSDYKRAMKKLAKLPNVYCKVSGFATEDKVFVQNLLDFLTGEFDASKLLYASNFPVVELYSSFDEHLRTVREYFGDDADFFSKNTKKLYQINKPQIFASVIRLRPEKADYYKKLHANPFASVNKKIKECGITKYQIFNRDDLLFSIMEYCGDDFEYDMAKMAQDAETQRWWQETDPCQMRIDGAFKHEWWADMKLVYDLNKESMNK